MHLIRFTLENILSTTLGDSVEGTFHFTQYLSPSSWHIYTNFTNYIIIDFGVLVIINATLSENCSLVVILAKQKTSES